jgi:hypothetical protein
LLCVHKLYVTVKRKMPANVVSGLQGKAAKSSPSRNLSTKLMDMKVSYDGLVNGLLNE